GWTACPGMGGRNQSEWVDGFARNCRPESRGIRTLVWEQWKNRKTRVRELLKRGISRNFALTTGCARKGP
ncbi:hypothetical protein D1AOALGA4SA_2603, partial [Olavius algarvensis Delta 1 endosymbiont]